MDPRAYIAFSFAGSLFFSVCFIVTVVVYVDICVSNGEIGSIEHVNVYAKKFEYTALQGNVFPSCKLFHYSPANLYLPLTMVTACVCGI